MPFCITSYHIIILTISSSQLATFFSFYSPIQITFLSAFVRIDIITHIYKSNIALQKQSSVLGDFRGQWRLGGDIFQSKLLLVFYLISTWTKTRVQKDTGFRKSSQSVEEDKSNEKREEMKKKIKESSGHLSQHFLCGSLRLVFVGKTRLKEANEKQSSSAMAQNIRVTCGDISLSY